MNLCSKNIIKNWIFVQQLKNFIWTSVLSNPTYKNKPKKEFLWLPKILESKKSTETNVMQYTNFLRRSKTSKEQWEEETHRLGFFCLLDWRKKMACQKPSTIFLFEQNHIIKEIIAFKFLIIYKCNLIGLKVVVLIMFVKFFLKIYSNY